ncbi:MAG: hypothetical protein Q4P06_04280 [Actinomycetaceae bacterium]|nr:hypothetical protein [Actinomycetaceae bacterium]
MFVAGHLPAVATPVSGEHRCELGITVDARPLALNIGDQQPTWVAANTWRAQYSLGWHLRAARKALVRIWEPDPCDPSTWAVDPEQIYLSILAALERSGASFIDRVEIPAVSAQELISKDNIAVLNQLHQDGLIGSWSVRVRTVKQYLRSLNFLGIKHVSVDAGVLQSADTTALLAAADRARVRLTLNLPSRFRHEDEAVIMKHQAVEVVFK